MDSRTRVQLAINHQEPDRVPIDIGGTRQTGIAASAYHRLKQHLGIDTPTRVRDVYQVLGEIENEIADRFGADILPLPRPVYGVDAYGERFKPWTLEDGTPVEVPHDFSPERLPSGDLVLRDEQGEIYAEMPEGGYYFDRIDKLPGALHTAPEDIEVQPRDSRYWDDVYQASVEYFERTDKALILQMGPPYELFFALGQGDFESWMVTLATEPDYVHALNQRLTEIWLEDLRNMKDAIGDRVMLIQFNDDLGTQFAPFLSPDMFRELIMPYYKTGLDWIHENTPCKVFMHCCGSIRPMIPLLIEMGVDCLNPVQITAADMSPEVLKAEFGDKITFWGGACDHQATLPRGTADEVAAEVESNVRTLMPGGGFVFAGVHNVQSQVPPENIAALYDTALKVGVYG